MTENTELYQQREPERTPLVELLSSRTETGAGDAWTEVLPLIHQEFPPETWGCSLSLNAYGPGAHANLYNVESQGDFRLWLMNNGVSISEYADAVGAVQYVSIEVYLLSLLPSGRSNRGWRIRIIGFPSLRLVVCGLSSNYQGTQNHNQMGKASHLLRLRALQVLDGENRDLLEDWPAATSQDWEERGLMTDPINSIGSLDISGYDEGRGAKLRMVRNTTVKKELSTFFAIKGFSLDEFEYRSIEQLRQLRAVAIALGKSH